MEEITYRQQLENQLQDARKRLADAIAANNFKADVNGQVALDIIDLQISTLVDGMTSVTPLDRDSYLQSHGQIAALRQFRATLNDKATADKQINAEVELLNEQIAQFESDQPAA